MLTLEGSKEGCWETECPAIASLVGREPKGQRGGCCPREEGKMLRLWGQDGRPRARLGLEKKCWIIALGRLLASCKRTGGVLS